MNFSEVFGEAKQFYDQLDPQHRQAVVQQFQQHFGNSSNPQLQQQAQALNPNNPDPQQLGQMHDYAQQNDPAAFNRAMDHPDIHSAMSQQGISDWGGSQGQYGEQSGYGDRGGYQQDNSGQPQYGGQGGDGDRGGYQQDNSGRGQYGDPGGRRGDRNDNEGFQQGGQYNQGDPNQQGQGSY